MPLLAGLVWTRALTGALAALGAVGVLWPRSLPVLALVAMGAVYARHRLPPGAITDTIRARLLTWVYLVRQLHWVGHGPRSTRLACEAAHLRSGGRAMDGGPARNEPLQLLYEYGILAALAMAALVWLLSPWLAWGTPVTAMLAAAGVVMISTSPLRAFGRWLRAGREGPLFGPPLLASLTVHLTADGQTHLYGVLDIEGDRAKQIAIARAFFEVGWRWMAQHKITDQEVSGDG